MPNVQVAISTVYKGMQIVTASVHLRVKNARQSNTKGGGLCLGRWCVVMSLLCLQIKWGGESRLKRNESTE